MTTFPAPDGLSAEARIGLAGENFTYALYANNPALYEYLVEETGFFTDQPEDFEGTITPTAALLGMDYDTYIDALNAGQPRHSADVDGDPVERAFPELGGIVLSTFGCTGCAEVYPCSTVMPNLPGRDVVRSESGSLADRVGFFAQSISSRTSITHAEARGLAQQVLESPGRAVLVEAYVRLVESEINRVVAAGATRID